MPEGKGNHSPAVSYTHLASVEEKCTVSDLYTKAVKQEKVKIGGQVKDGVWLLAKYLQLALEQFENIERITFSVPKTDIDISKMLKGMGRFLGIPKENIAVQDFKESFCHYICLLYTSLPYGMM